MRHPEQEADVRTTGCRSGSTGDLVGHRRRRSRPRAHLRVFPVADTQTFVIPSQPQGEAITFSADSSYVYVASAGLGQPLYKIPV